MTAFRRCVLHAAVLLGVALGSHVPAIRAQANPLDATERANVQLALDNLQTLLNDWRAAVQRQPQPRTRKQQAQRKQVEDEIGHYDHVLQNLEEKFRAGKIKSVQGLDAGSPIRYKHGDDESSPRAAYCDDQTFVRTGDRWIRCDDGDIIIDAGEVNPTPGTAINPRTPKPAKKDERWGWALKWTLLHILVHEKHHEIMIRRQVDEENNRHAGEPDSQRRLHLQLARRNAATPDRHAEVYQGQIRLLEIYREVLEAGARAGDDQLKDRIDWLTEERKNLRESAKKAVHGHEFAFDTCGYPSGLQNGTLGLYVTWFGEFWRMDVDVRNGKAYEHTLVDGAGPVRDVAVRAVMPQDVFSALHVQVDPCEYLKEASAAGRIKMAKTAAELADLLPSTGVAVEVTVGLVVPSDLRPGDVATGTIVADPDRYRESPALSVINIKTTLETEEGGTPRLDALEVNAGDDRWQPGSAFIALRIPATVTRVRISVRRTGETGSLVDQELRLALGESSTVITHPSAQSYETPSLYAPDEVRVVRGPFDGLGDTTALELDGTPCTPLAETPRAHYFRLADTTKPGAARLTMKEGDMRASFSIVVLGLTMGADRLDLIRGQSTRFNAVVTGPDRLPQEVWRAAPPFDVTSLAMVKTLAPGFKAPKAGDAGVILFVIRNTSPDTIAIDKAKNDAIVLTLDRADFRSGPYRYDGTIKSKKSGGFTVQGTVVAFVSPTRGAPM